MKKIISLFLFGFCFFLFNVCEVRAEIVPFPQPKPNINVSPGFNAVDGNNALKIVESPATQEAILQKIEGGAEYGMSQKGYVPNPVLEGVSIVYSAYQALSALYGDDPDYQCFIQPYKDMDNGGIFGEAWGQLFPLNTIYGTFVYGEIRLDALIDEKTGEVKAAVLSYQNGFEETVDNFLKKVSNNFYCPVKPDFDCDAYGLSKPAPVFGYSYNVAKGGEHFFIVQTFGDDVLAALPEDAYCCYVKHMQRDETLRDLVVVTSTPLDAGSFKSYTFAQSKNIPIIYSESMLGEESFRGIGYKGGYYFYIAPHALRMWANLASFDYYYPYISFHMELNDFMSYYVDNAGELSVGGVLLTPVQPSSQGFPQTGNIYNPSDLQDYNNDQKKKIEECPIISPDTAPYPGSAPAPGVEPERWILPQIIPDPATGGITVSPIAPVPDSGLFPSDDPVIDPETGQEIDNGALAPYMFDLSKKFPFCVPFDLIKCVKILKQKPAAPSFDWTLRVDMINFEYTFHIDLACFEPAAKVCRIMFTLLFIVSLIVVTRNMIRG